MPSIKEENVADAFYVINLENVINLSFFTFSSEYELSYNTNVSHRPQPQPQYSGYTLCLAEGKIENFQRIFRSLFSLN